MSVTANRSILLAMSGDVEFREEFAAAENAAAPGGVNVVSLASGNNTIAVPSGFTITAVTIIPPAGNTEFITLKGVNGDTGIQISPTEPTSVALDPITTSFVLLAGNTINGVRLVWS